MDPMVIKYLGLAAITYGTHAYLAIAQVLLCLYLIVHGITLFSRNKGLPWKNWLMIISGVAFILPLFGTTWWIAVAACPVAIYLLMTDSEQKGPKSKRRRQVLRKGLLVSALLIFAFTIWEGRDLVRAGWDVNYKAVYWRNKEVSVWQQENNPNVPKTGELAPDFELTDVTGTKTVRLADFRNKRPVVLLFGSFT